jgi:hypothetical protein
MLGGYRTRRACYAEARKPFTRLLSRCKDVGLLAISKLTSRTSFERLPPWVDQLFLGIWEGYKGLRDPGLVELVGNAKVDAEFIYVAYPEATRRDVEKALRVSNTFEQLLDAVQT